MLQLRVRLLADGDILVLASAGLSAMSFPGKAVPPEKSIQHFAHLRVDDWVRKMARYTTAEAESHVAAGERTTVLRALFEPAGYFLYKYIVQLGFLDGAHGLALASLLSNYRSVMHWKWWDLQQSQQGPKESPDCPPRI